MRKEKEELSGGQECVVDMSSRQPEFHRWRTVRHRRAIMPVGCAFLHRGHYGCGVLGSAGENFHQLQGSCRLDSHDQGIEAARRRGRHLELCTRSKSSLSRRKHCSTYPLHFITSRFQQIGQRNASFKSSAALAVARQALFSLAPVGKSDPDRGP